MSAYSYDAEIISVGNELLIGRIVNTNASWLGRKLTMLGYNVRRITTVRDDLNDIASAIREALARKPRVIIMTGGLGPTFDDMTSEALAKALGRRWVINDDAYREVKEKYDRRGLELTEHRVKMAKMPEGAVSLRNPVGVAPGILVEEDHVLIIALPGVPAEMKGIFESQVETLLKERGPRLEYAEAYLQVKGVPESTAAPVLDKIMKEHVKVYIKSHPKGKEEVSVIVYHITSYDKNLEDAKENVRKALEKLKSELLKLGGEVKEIKPEEVEL